MTLVERIYDLGAATEATVVFDKAGMSSGPKAEKSRVTPAQRMAVFVVVCLDLELGRGTHLGHMG